MIVKLEEDENGDLFVPIDEVLMSDLGWKSNDTIQWTVNDDGTFTLTKVVKEKMNERFEYCLYQAGLTAQGCWDEFDDYAKEAIERFAELIVQECLDIVNRIEYSYHEADPLWETAQLIKERFGVE